MIKLYFKQAWRVMKENPVVNGLSVAGAALAIAAVMLIMLVLQINMASYAPESERARMLHVISARAIPKAEDGTYNNSRIGQRVVKELFYSLKTPKAVSAYCDNMVSVSLPSKRMFTRYVVKYTDDAFWHIFDLTFVKGTSFSKSDFEGGQHRAVITSELAHKLFGSDDGAIGKKICFDWTSYTVCGVVQTPSGAAFMADADLWVPYTSNESLNTPASLSEGLTGNFGVVMLAHSAADFSAIRQEFEQATKHFNTTTSEVEIDFFAGALDRFDLNVVSYNGYTNEIDYTMWFVNMGGIILLLLLLPALNMIGVTLTSFRGRMEEIGIRKAFGATSFAIFRQMMYENFLITLLGGAIGLLLSFALIFICKDAFMNDRIDLQLKMLIRPEAFLIAFLLVFILNFLCAFIPAICAGRLQIVQSLNKED